MIRLTPSGRAIVEGRPVSECGPVYYTPSYIVDDIVKHTVGRLVEGKTPAEVAELRILTANILLVDIDPQAVEVNTLYLMLKVLEGETA